MPAQFIDLGHVVARITDGKVLELFSPAFGEDGVHFPAANVAVVGEGRIRHLADALAPYGAVHAAEQRAAAAEALVAAFTDAIATHHRAVFGGGAPVCSIEPADWVLWAGIGIQQPATSL